MLQTLCIFTAAIVIIVVVVSSSSSSAMHAELSVALNFIISHLYNKLPRRRVDVFREELFHGFELRFAGHWYPDEPTKGSGFRCVKLAADKVCHSKSHIFWKSAANECLLSEPLQCPPGVKSRVAKWLNLIYFRFRLLCESISKSVNMSDRDFFYSNAI